MDLDAAFGVALVEAFDARGVVIEVAVSTTGG